MAIAIAAPRVVRILEADDYVASYPELWDRAYQVAHRLVFSREDATDIAQETLARAYARWSSVRKHDAPLAWVSRVSANLAIDLVRRRERAKKYAPDAPTPESAPDETAIDLARALRALPRRQRQIVTLRYLADLSEQDVATAVGCSVGTVKSSASRGLASLRAALGREEVV